MTAFSCTVFSAGRYSAIDASAESAIEAAHQAWAAVFDRASLQRPTIDCEIPAEGDRVQAFKVSGVLVLVAEKGASHAAD